ncbi:uncharacterized protein DNG_08404 [Cephalotrichum gorgonifer]|uniref:Box C/D snoRNA protein 1 n=1 Tax=Cephalotrichum gorgonifer TaxID=2041049 RepID=A0AAE8SZ56_9PEZI|nr:uncharacterized protein DNG_08404 [Cephalotrichum gorgonifer]
MGDSLLTNLCSICHVSAPKYTCPRCKLRTCSLPCIKRHKARSDCSGIRDATAYVPRHKLATPAGVDHDYNFISAIERERERSEKELVGERGIIDKNELKREMIDGVEVRVNPRDGKRRKVVVTRELKSQDDLEWSGIRSRLEKFGVVLVRAPMGMTRRRENQTRFFKRSRRIEWFVEWFLVAGEEGNTTSTRVTTKVVDDLPIYEAFLRNQQTKAFVAAEAATKDASHPTSSTSTAITFQDQHTSAWVPGTSTCSQHPRTRQWTELSREPRQAGSTEEDLRALKDKVDFYLSRPQTTSSASTTLIPVDPALKLHDALIGTAVLEYPTIHVVERSVGTPAGFVVGSRPKRGTKRKAEDGSRDAKRRLIEEIEDGKVIGGGEKDEEESESESDSESESESDSEAETEDSLAEVLNEVEVSDLESEDSDGAEPGEEV